MAQTSMLNKSLDDVIKAFASGDGGGRGRRRGGGGGDGSRGRAIRKSAPARAPGRGGPAVYDMEMSDEAESYGGYGGGGRGRGRGGRYNSGGGYRGGGRGRSSNREMPFSAGGANEAWGGGSPGGRARVRRARPGCFVKVQGLEFSVLQQDLMEALSSVGEVISCWIDYDRTDRSMGTGAAIFSNPVDAERAVDSFDGRVLDGKRLQLHIEETEGWAPRGRGRGGW